jgi:hypothetical protein
MHPEVSNLKISGDFGEVSVTVSAASIMKTMYCGSFETIHTTCQISCHFRMQSNTLP